MWGWLSHHNKELGELLKEKTERGQGKFPVRMLYRKIRELKAEKESDKNTFD